MPIRTFYIRVKKIQQEVRRAKRLSYQILGHFGAVDLEDDKANEDVAVPVPIPIGGGESDIDNDNSVIDAHLLSHEGPVLKSEHIQQRHRIDGLLDNVKVWQEQASVRSAQMAEAMKAVAVTNQHVAHSLEGLSSQVAAQQQFLLGVVQEQRDLVKVLVALVQRDHVNSRDAIDKL